MSRPSSLRRESADVDPALLESGRDRAVIRIAEALRRYGYEAATMSILGRETGLGRSSLYHYFPGGKEEMALAALDLAEVFLRDDLTARRGGAGTVEQLAGDFIARLKDYYRGGAVGCVFATLTLHDCPPAVAARVAGLMDFWIAELTRRLEELGLAAPRSAAAAVVRQVQGGLVVALATGDPGQFDAALTEIARIILPGRA